MTFEKNKEILEKEKEQLLKEIEYYQKEDPYLSPDRSSSNTLDDNITEIEGHDRVTATSINLKTRLFEVSNALERIENGSYGICKNCGNKIPDERLGVMPSASLCMDCHGK